MPGGLARWARAVGAGGRRLSRFLREGGYRRDLPPLRLRDVGPGDFEAIGREFLGHFVALGALRPSDAVLEIGCGPGRMALPLTRYLGRDGRYLGVDVVAGAIAWCRQRITSRHPHFGFEHLDVFNRRYNPAGSVPASEVAFPWPDASFDFILLTSVFTHMLPEDIGHYLEEIGRLVRPTGRVFATFFLLNPAQAALAAEGRNAIRFGSCRGGYGVRDQEVPESAVALDEARVREMYRRAGLRIEDPIRYGTWSGRSDGLSFQDIVLARRADERRVSAP